jgi:HAD superfamily hydrolase (TIGR01509 family)
MNYETQDRVGIPIMDKIRAIIFDMDGVLVDAATWHFDALNQALGLFGYRITEFDHHQRYDGLPTRDKLRMLSAEQGLPESLHGFINEMKQQYLGQIADDRCQPNEVHVQTLSRLIRDGYRLGLASNSIRPTVDRLINLAGLSGMLEFKLSNNDVAKPKPDAQIYQLAISTLSMSPQQCLVVEDGDYGVEAATAAGANVLRVNSVDEVTYDNILERIEQIERSDHGKRFEKRAA